MVIAGRVRCGGACRTSRCREKHRAAGMLCRLAIEFSVPPNDGVSSRVLEGRGRAGSSVPKHATAAFTAAMIIAAACALHVWVFQTFALCVSPGCMVFNFAFVGFSTFVLHIVWQLSFSWMQWAARMRAYVTRCARARARAAREMAPAVGCWWSDYM